MIPSSLLPAGVHDYLLNEARTRFYAAHTLVQTYEKAGYSLVLPPLLEFEKTLLPAIGNNLSHNTFRVMDPLSHEMMALRADITPQIARIATTRLKSQPRPLRLCYAGEVLRVTGNSLNYERQSLQTGFELIGQSGVEADAEVILLAVKALEEIGVKNITVDLTLPPLLPLLADHFALSPALRQQVFETLQRKDSSGLEGCPAEARALFEDLLQKTGGCEIEQPDCWQGFPAVVQSLLHMLQQVRDTLKTTSGLVVTVDLTEQRGFLYHSGVCFSLFAEGFRGEIGRGGRYIVGENEAAVGFSASIDPLLRNLPKV